jgi:hypothetical protein
VIATLQEYHQETLNNLRIAQRNARKLCCTMLDTMGPEIIVINRCAGHLPPLVTHARAALCHAARLQPSAHAGPRMGHAWMSSDSVASTPDNNPWAQMACNTAVTIARSTACLAFAPPPCPFHRSPEEPISLTAGQTVTLTCNKSVQASSSVLPISYPSLAATGLAPGSQMFVGQYLFTGSETSSVYLTVQEVRARARAHTRTHTGTRTGHALGTDRPPACVRAQRRRPTPPVPR